MSCVLTRVPLIAGQSDTWWNLDVSFPNGFRLWAEGPKFVWFVLARWFVAF